MLKQKLIHIARNLIFFLVFFVIVISICVYYIAFSSNVNLNEKESSYLKIPTNSGYNELLSIIEKEKLLKNTNTFLFLARKKNLKSHIYPGRYEITKGMNNNQIINLLRSGKQQALNLTFNNIRTKARLAQVIGNQIESDSSEIARLLDDNNYTIKYGFTTETILCMFIPNTYQFLWNTNADSFFNRMKKEYNRFWNIERTEKAQKLGFTPVEISILAAIVDEEALIDEEMPKIAGVYMNRLKKNIPLGADPTIKFALGNFGIKRILTKDLEVNSPYNTYKKRGLPPGPICIPSIAAIDAVLNYEQHSYLYFCAKEDFSGYHNFAKTLKEHNRNALLYQKALNMNKVYR